VSDVDPSIQVRSDNGAVVVPFAGTVDASMLEPLRRVSSDHRGLLAVSRDRAKRVHGEDNWRAST
jgi:hypothetical protein